MKINDLKEGMIIQTTHNRFGVVAKNCINIIYDPDFPENYYECLEKIPLNNLIENNGRIGVGFVVTKELKEKDDNLEYYSIGESVFWYEFISIYTLNKIYDNEVGIYPSIKVK